MRGIPFLAGISESTDRGGAGVRLSALLTAWTEDSCENFSTPILMNGRIGVSIPGFPIDWFSFPEGDFWRVSWDSYLLSLLC